MLLKVDGVESCDVSFEKKKATVEVRKDVDPEKLAAAVTGDFSASVEQ